MNRQTNGQREALRGHQQLHATPNNLLGRPVERVSPKRVVVGVVVGGVFAGLFAALWDGVKAVFQ